MKRILIVGVLALGLAGCGPKHFDESYKFDPHKSEAMNVALATEMITNDDLKRAEANGASTANLVVTGAISGYANAVGAASNMNLGVGAIAWLVNANAQSWSPLKYDHFIVWMPKSYAADDDAAAKALAVMLSKAAESSLPDGYSSDGMPEPTSFGFGINYGCDTPLHGVDRTLHGTLSAWAKGVEHAVNPMDGSDGYFWSFWNSNSDTSAKALSGVAFSREVNGKPVAVSVHDSGFSLSKFYQKQSSKLPKWVYIYVSPSSSANGEAYMLNRGKVLRF